MSQVQIGKEFLITLQRAARIVDAGQRCLVRKATRASWGERVWYRRRRLWEY